MDSLAPILASSSSIKSKVVLARNEAHEGNFDKARVAYLDALNEAKSSFEKNSAEYGLMLLEVADFYERFGKHLQLYGIRCQIRNILIHYSAAHSRKGPQEDRRELSKTEV